MKQMLADPQAKAKLDALAGMMKRQEL